MLATARVGSGPGTPQIPAWLFDRRGADFGFDRPAGFAGTAQLAVAVEVFVQVARDFVDQLGIGGVGARIPRAVAVSPPPEPSGPELEGSKNTPNDLLAVDALAVEAGRALPAGISLRRTKVMTVSAAVPP